MKSQEILKKAQTFNFGFQRRLETASALKMTWGFTANNVGGLKFNRSDNETSPADQEPEFSTGLSWQPDWGPFRWLFAFDLRDLTMKHADDTYCQTKKETKCIIRFYIFIFNNNITSGRQSITPLFE